MTTPSSTYSHQTLTDTLVTQMSTGPAFREVAATLLREQLKDLYPTLDIDPNVTMVGAPLWGIDDGHVVPVDRHYQALTDILAAQAVLAVPALYIEGEHFLTQLPIIEPAVHLPVRILDIAGLINMLAPVMLRAYQQAQMEYWNASEADSGPRWHALSTTLRDFWNVQQAGGLSDDECEMARQLYRTPDYAQRSLNDPQAVKAYVIDIDRIDDDGKVTHLDEHLISVLISERNGHEVILTHSLLGSFKKYTNLEQLGQDLPQLLSSALGGMKVQWRLVEPGGDFFDYLACAFISLQIMAIGSISFSDLREPGASQQSLTQAPTPQATLSESDLQPYVDALPDWLTEASASDQDAFSRHLKDLATLHSLNRGKRYQDDLSPIQQYTLDQLNAEMLKDHPEASTQWLDNLDIVVRSPVIWGLFPVPGQFDTTQFSLTELALQNLIALPQGVKTLRQRNPQTLPDWLTLDYLESLISRVDIGNTYPAQVKTVLLDDPLESARRQLLYTQHLRIQLPLLALQCKIRDEGGINEQGYRYICALMQAAPADREVDGQTIVIRPLGFVPTRRLDTTPDVVANMFVIGPQDMSAGPCLLYRPLLDKPLSQFPSPDNLLYALQQSISLRESVLAWLPDRTRDDYAQFVFPNNLPSPWAVATFVLDPLKALAMSGPVKLSQNVVIGDLFATLYNANANALVTLADRQSVSDTEARWATFKRIGWAIFNAALPFLGRITGTAAWIWQIMEQLQDVVDAKAHPEQASPWAALADLLLNIGMAITLHCVTHRSPGLANKEKPLPIARPQPPTRLKPEIVRKLATISSDTLGPHDRPLYISGAVNRTPTRLATVLDSFKVTKPDTLGAVNDKAGAHQHLYRGGQHWYAPVGTRWFQVLVDENDTVLIADPTRPERTGPPLIHNSQGQWFVDTRLRLRGGGPKLMTQKARDLAKKKADELREKLKAFENRKKTAQGELQRARSELDEGPSTSVDTLRRTYIRTLETQRTEYESALQMLKEMHIHEPSAEYAPKALSYIKVQTKMTQAAMAEILVNFTPKWRTVYEQLQHQAKTAQARPVEDFREMRDLTGRLLIQLEYMHGRFTELKSLGKDGALLLSTLKSTMPVYTPDDLRAIRVTLNRNLCLPRYTFTTEPAAWVEIDRIIDTADIAVQCLHDTLKESSDRRLDERIDTLSNLIEQFQLIDERLQDFPVEFSENAITDQLLEVRGELTYLQRRAVKTLGVLSTQRSLFRSRPTPPSTPPRPAKQFIHTRYHGLLIGEPRLSSVGLETGLVDIRSPLTNQILSTYHEKSKGVWVVRERTPPPSREPVVLDIQLSINQGQALLDGLPTFLARAKIHANQADRAPFGIEYLYHQHARQLEQAISTIEQALTQHNITEIDVLSTSASGVTKALDAALIDLNQQSNQLVQRTLKAYPPTVSGLEWLKHHNVITIKKTQARRRIKGAKPDYLDEYTIIDRGNDKVLWYAHFHYSTDWTPDKAYLSARLKTPAEHALGAAADSTKGLDRKQAIAFYRSEISLEKARELFFDRPKSTSST
ncbi:DUF6543 domain-containing protein [Pseudomonas sp. FH1]|uniref:dermonecrotic toxin domain-containing protein n=1 Tax=Pseudomonas sp. FH1 TaxID=1284392 RepID=UPI0003DCAB99|nr:DUF6543 domain-containing protein [Pseudomonas sp. FH1]ETK24406.1 hypothetical protein H096_05907 [Pseudomonas sp. FH1]